MQCKKISQCCNCSKVTRLRKPIKEIEVYASENKNILFTLKKNLYKVEMPFFGN